MMPAPQLAHRTNCTNEAMDDSTDDETLSIFAPKSSDTLSSEDEQEEDEEDQEVVQPGPGVQHSQGIEDLHSRHPWFAKWVRDGKNIAGLLPEQYPTGYDPKRNESK